ncbi:MAG: hypothetical protein WD607_10285 [Candidatus Paceibacterota bacterium]
MTINEIAYRLNELASRDNHTFAKIQEIRNKHGIKPRTWSPFAAFSIKDHYAFHAGGRKEFQFNIGEDELNNKTVFRFGLAFALIKDKSLHNSKAEFKSSIERFNKFLSTNTEFFKGYKMWYYSKHQFVEYFESVKPINNTIFQAENFIFIGKYFEKQTSDIIDSDLKNILHSFDYLLPLYETIQFDQKKSEKRIARLCWNDNGWVMPSGNYSKSIHEGSHEAKYGYGHEEWLFDISKLIDSYHYGFLEPVRKQHNAFANNTYDVWLYTIDGETKKRYWIGEIENIEVIDKETADVVKEEYVKRKWLNEMEEQIKLSGANASGFSNWEAVDLFNVRFHPANVRLNDAYIEIPQNNPIHEQSRYTFTFYKDEFDIYTEDDVNSFEFIPSNNTDDQDVDTPKSKTHIREPKAVEIVYLHDAISRRLTRRLKEKYGTKNVTREHPAGYGANKIDIVVKDSNDLIFYEIKTYTTIKTSVREAIGQLMEYACWTNHMKAKQLIVITQPHSDVESVKIYFKHLRNTFNLPIYYQSYDFEENILSELV